MLSSLVGWIAGHATPSFIEGQSLSAEVQVPKTTRICASADEDSIIILRSDWLAVVCVICRFGLPG